MSDETPRPAPEGYDSWPAYWQAQGMPWRTEPEIDEERQIYLAERRAVTPDIQQGIYPFRDIKLGRADVEWLLATHESGGMRGPVDWGDQRQREREGLDLRGASLQRVNLVGLPLARLRGGLSLDEYSRSDKFSHEAAAAHFEGAKLTGARLESAALIRAHFEDADLGEAILRCAVLRSARLEGTFVGDAKAQGADLRRAYFSESTALEHLSLDGDEEYGAASVVDAHWDSVNLSVIMWSEVRSLGDEQVARQRKGTTGKRKDGITRLTEFQAAVRANRQLAVALEAQGLNEDAARFTYRAQALQRQVFWRQGQVGRWAFSLLLAVLAGYGYRLRNILLAYGVTLIAFAAAYLLVGLPSTHPVPTLQAVADAFQVSLTAIHGRVFFEQFGIGSTLAWVAAVESVVGIVIEGVFVAMLVQRFFAR